MSHRVEVENLSDIAHLVNQLAQGLREHNKTITTVESCTGGLVAASFTDLAGSSAWFDRGFVSYSNLAKRQMVGVRSTTLDEHGAVSEAVAIEMADGGCEYSEANCAIAITGIAGPGGATPDKPLGMVCFAWSGFTANTHSTTRYFEGDRAEVRAQSLYYVIEQAILLVNGGAE